MLSIRDVSQILGQRKVLENISFEVRKHEIVALMGPSGCGKSSLLNMISGFLSPDYGTINYVGENISFVFQDDRLLPWKTVWENIAIVGEEKSDEKEICELIREVGLEGFEHYKPSCISGGMKKRCGIARAFYYKSDLLLMDEPFQGLDFCLRQEMIKMLMNVWEKRQHSILFVTHEIDEAFAVAGKIIVLSKSPARVLSEIQLPPYHERNNKKEQLNRIREQIIEMIT